jgi:hypothetical protein
MIFVSLTRLRVRSVWFMPGFFVYAIRSQKQVRSAAGFQRGALLPDRERTFWTMTAWNSEASMRAYMISGAHKQAMPKLLHWCDEASVAHWMQEETELPTWEQADERMRREGRVSKVLHPSDAHASLSYKVPRTTGSATIRPV